MRKLIILATAIAALAAIALPASASAYTSNWKMENKELTANATIEVSGHVEFSGGITCENSETAVELTAGSGTGTVTKFECINPVPIETLAAVCTGVENVTVQNLPWMADDEGTYVKITGIMITNDMEGGSFCPKEITVEDDEGVFITPENTAEMSTGELSGSVNTGLGTQEVHGEGEVTGAGSGTYGL